MSQMAQGQDGQDDSHGSDGRRRLLLPRKREPGDRLALLGWRSPLVGGDLEGFRRLDKMKISHDAPHLR
jgi:hypothetical protein